MASNLYRHPLPTAIAKTTNKDDDGITRELHLIMLMPKIQKILRNYSMSQIRANAVWWLVFGVWSEVIDPDPIVHRIIIANNHHFSLFSLRGPVTAHSRLVILARLKIPKNPPASRESERAPHVLSNAQRCCWLLAAAIHQRSPFHSTKQ